VSDLLEDIETAYVPRAVVINLTLEEGIILDQLAVLMKVDRLQVVPELLRRNMPSPNGQGYKVPCSGCGLPFQSPRRPLPGKKHWCENCRKTGEPGADRARRYRDRKAANQGAK
jgi:hypothetical protein